MCSTLGPEYQVKRITFRLGKRLEQGEASSNGLYALVKEKSNWTLRVCLFKELAEDLCDWKSRYLAECFILKVENLK